MDHDAIAKSMIDAALKAGSITRTDYNHIRRCDALLSDNTAAQWHALNDTIAHKQCQIVEDGDTVFKTVLSFNGAGNCDGVFSL